MKYLIQNYSSAISSEPLYLAEALSQSNVDVKVWANPNDSAFDAFDTTQPDVFITHYQYINSDIIQYLEQSDRKIKLVVNVTGATDQQLSSIKEVLGDNLVLFTNSLEAKSGVQTLYPAADIFNLVAVPPFEQVPIDVGFISNKFSETLEEMSCKNDVYHLLYVGDEPEYSGFDLKADIRSIKKLLGLYKQLHIVGDADLCSSQLFFDVCLNCSNITITSTDTDKFNKGLDLIFSNVGGVDNVREEMKNQIKARHTPFHRASRLMKFTGDKESMQKVENVKAKLSEALKEL